MSKEQLQYVFDLIRKESKGLRKEMDDNDSIVGEGYLEEIMQRVEYESQFKPPVPVPTIQNPFPSRLPTYGIEQVNNLPKPSVTPNGSTIPSTPSVNPIVNRPVNPSITPLVNRPVNLPVTPSITPTVTPIVNPTVTPIVNPTITPIVNRFPNRTPEEITVAPRGEIPSIIITPKSSSKDLSTVFKIKKSRKCRKCGCGLGKEDHKYVYKRFCLSAPPNPEDAQEEEEEEEEDGEDITDENVRSEQDDDVNDSAEENNNDEEEEEEDYHTHEHSSSDNDEESEPDAPSPPPPPKKSSDKPPKKKKKTSHNEESM